MEIIIKTNNLHVPHKHRCTSNQLYYRSRKQEKEAAERERKYKKSYTIKLDHYLIEELIRGIPSFKEIKAINEILERNYQGYSYNGISIFFYFIGNSKVKIEFSHLYKEITTTDFDLLKIEKLLKDYCHGRKN